MQNRTTQELFDLIKSMSKCEKKNFNRYARRNSNSESLKVLSIFKILNSMEQYDEKAFAQKIKTVQCRQLPSLKVFLYNQLLDSLRLFRKSENIMLQLHQLMDHANILYSQGFYLQSLKLLKRLKTQATTSHQIAFLFQVVMMEKKIELVHGLCEPDRINVLNKELEQYNQQLSLIGSSSNHSLLFYGWYKRLGVLRCEEDRVKAGETYLACCRLETDNLSFYPKLYLLQAKTFYHLIMQQSNEFYAAAQAWVQHFDACPQMKEVEKAQYERGLFYLGEAAFLKGEVKELEKASKQLQKSSDKYYALLLQLHLCQLDGQVKDELIDEAYRLVQSLSNPIRLYKTCYLAAKICAVHQQFDRAVDFTIIAQNQKSDVRPDLQYQLRKLHLQAHEQLENFAITDYLQLSARRFAKKHQLTG